MHLTDWNSCNQSFGSYQYIRNFRPKAAITAIIVNPRLILEGIWKRALHFKWQDLSCHFEFSGLYYIWRSWIDIQIHIPKQVICSNSEFQMKSTFPNQSLSNNNNVITKWNIADLQKPSNISASSPMATLIRVRLLQNKEYV